MTDDFPAVPTRVAKTHPDLWQAYADLGERCSIAGPLPPETRRAELMQVEDNIESVKRNKGGVIESHGAFVDFTPGWPPARSRNWRS